MRQGALDLGSTGVWSNDEHVNAHRDARFEAAVALDQEIRELVTRGRRNHSQLCDRLGRMRRERLHEPLGVRSFPQYAVKVGAATSEREARQLADLADQLRDLPHLRRAFEEGRAHVSNVREAAPVATPSNDEEWARKCASLTYDQLRAEVKTQRGEEPTGRLALELPLDVRARFHQFVESVRRRLGRQLTNAEVFALLLDAGELAELGPSAAASEPARVPPCAARLVATVCTACEKVEVQGPDGPVALSPAAAESRKCDPELQDSTGKVTRKIPPRTVGSSRVDLQACKLEYSIVSPK